MNVNRAWSLFLAVFLLSLLAAPPALADDDCDYTADRAAAIDLDGAKLIEIEARAGSLVVEGRSGLTRVSATGEACASDEDLLEGIQITTRRSGDRVRVSVEIPDSGWSFRNRTARLNLTVEVPDDVALSIDDSSGSIKVRGVAATEIEDSSGEIIVEGVGGNLRIDDSSGSIRVRDVAGDVVVDDSSGGIDVRGVRGSVTIEDDSSGGIEIADVEGDVMVRDDSSGGIRVSEIGGDFTVRHDGSGGIDYSGVRGRVDVPRGKQ